MRVTLVLAVILAVAAAAAPLLDIHRHAAGAPGVHASRVEAGAGPEQLHIALTENSGEMRFFWVVQVSYNTTGYMLQGQCRVGLAAGVYASAFTASSSSYSEQGFNGTIFTATASNLSLDTTYHYVCGDAQSGFTQDAAFLNAPAPGTSRTVHVINWGDM